MSEESRRAAIKTLFSLEKGKVSWYFWASDLAGKKARCVLSRRSRLRIKTGFYKLQNFRRKKYSFSPVLKMQN
jgi:hypothetical protein